MGVGLKKKLQGFPVWKYFGANCFDMGVAEKPGHQAEDPMFPNINLQHTSVQHLVRAGGRVAASATVQP